MKKQLSNTVLASISIVLITTDNQNVIETRLKTAKKIAEGHAESVQLIVVNNGSIDKTADILTAMKKKDKKLEVITLRKTMNIGDAFLSSVAKIKGEWFFYTLGDEQYLIHELSLLLKAVSKEVDMVNGLRTILKRNVKTLKNNLRNQFIKKVFILPIKDISSDFKLMRTATFKASLFRHIEKDFHKELMVKLKARKARFKEVAISFQPIETPIVNVGELKNSLGAFRRKMRFIDSVKLS